MRATADDADDPGGALGATYRIQFTKGIRLRRDGRACPYLARLGISHLYASPCLKARPGSTHGYGVTDHNALHPVLGRRGRFRAHGAALGANGLGRILNVPPWSLCHYPSSGAPSFGARPTATSC
jgi:maltooligosyltrehalose synthase